MTSLGHGTGQDMSRRPPGGSNVTPSDIGTVRHAYVMDSGGVFRPGMFLEWRATGNGGWEGLVIYPERWPTGWATVQAWMPRDRISFPEVG